ncbi:MAG: hypothetical protein KDA84_04190, partial [Planctomycetaceae bacterium]|nr:hypothetical protein [Planctomycetaceae bacterium]
MNDSTGQSSTPSNTPTTEELQDEMLRVWPAARLHWSRFLLLAEPTHNNEQQSIAQIHLVSRQVSLNFPIIQEKNLIGSLEALLAHEIGHHVRYPGSLSVQARMRMLERSLLPFENFSLINLFTDLMINEHLGHKLRDQLVAVYQAFTGEGAFHEKDKQEINPSFLFYMAIYEELWRMPPGSLMGPYWESFADSFPGYRAEAQVLSQDVFHLGPNIYTQFLYFLSVLTRYLVMEGEDPQSGSPYECDCDDPSPDDWADSLRPTAAEQEAIRRAIEKGWFTKSDEDRLKDLSDIEERIANLPGFGTQDAEFVPEVMAAYYRQEAERYLFRPPPQRRLGEAVVPTTIEEWEPGDAVRDIDWLSTLLERGDVLGAAQPLKRDRIAEYEGQEVNLWQPRMEIYLDVSGSMPDPRRAINAMTLASQILLMGTIRAGGWVRALIYSHSPVLFWEWSRSEIELSRFLMHYVGGGTDFPFAVLDRSVQECRRDQPIRVIISDTDFDHNYQAAPQNAEHFLEAVQSGPHTILL